jgi:hypothetical protein
VAEQRAALGKRRRRGGNATSDGIVRRCTASTSGKHGGDLGRCGHPASHRITWPAAPDLVDWACPDHAELVQRIGHGQELTPLAWL